MTTRCVQLSCSSRSSSLIETSQANPKNRIAQKVLAAEATELIHGGALRALNARSGMLTLGCAAVGLNQALAATSVFYGSDLASLITPEIIQALDGAATSSASTAAIPSLLVRLPKEDFVGQALEKLAIASGLMASKSEFHSRSESAELR